MSVFNRAFIRKRRRTLALNANYAQNLAVVEANADAARRQLVFTLAQGESQLATSWNASDPSYYPMNYPGLPGVSRTVPELLTTARSALGSDSSVILSRLPIMIMPTPYGSTDYWTIFRNLNSSVVSMETKNAELQRDAAVANAASVYVSAYASGYDAETRAALNDAETQFHADIDAETALDDDLWSALGTAFTGELTAIRNADTTSDLLSYVSSSVGASISYALSLANAYGDFQIANRQNKLAGTTLFNPRRGAYQADVAWAQQTKSLRNQYYSASGSAISGYYATVNSAIATYNAAALNAVLSAEQSYFNAERTFSQNALDAYFDYVLADFSASKNLALAYLTASVAEVTANYAHEAQLASARAAAYEEAVDALLSDLAAADLKKFETLSTLQENFASAQSSANAADAALGSFNESALAAFKAQTAAAAETAKAEADAAYQNSWRSAWNDAFLEMLAETADLSSAYDSIGALTKTALETADLAYRAAAFGAWEDFLDEAFENNQIYAHQRERINQGGTVANDVFENPTFDYEVCFTAGTQILMADGSTKSIEQIQPGDVVLAADHLNPESKPQAAEVVRFFDNGEKDVVKLSFADDQEVVCTPEHPFYVIGKGWVHAQDLQQGDFCLSATGDKIAFVSKENLVEKQRVYNFEVDNLHTYFVGSNFVVSILVHNLCLFGEEFVMPWDENASWAFGDTVSLYGSMLTRAVVGTTSGAAAGAATGAVVGAGVGVFVGGAGAVPGAVTGATTGAIGGGISGLISAAMAPSYETLGETFENSGMNGVVSGVTGGIAGPLGGTSLSIARNSYSVVGGGGLAVSTENIAVVTVSQTDALLTVGTVSTGSPFFMQSQRYSDDDLWIPRQRDKLPNNMKARHIYDKTEFDQVVARYGMNRELRRRFHEHIGDLKSSGETFSRTQLDKLAREFLESIGK